MSRYSPSSYSSRYGDRDRDYSSSYLSGGSRRDYSSSGTDRLTPTNKSYNSYSSSTTSPYSSYTSKYGDYSSKYGNKSYSAGKKMEESTAPIVKDEIEELNYDEPKTPVGDEQQEVLQESQIDEFEQEDDNKDVAETVEVKMTFAEEDDESFVEEPEDVEEEPLAPAPQIESVEPKAKPKTDAPTTDENRTPSPTVLNAKKLGGIPWPPKNNDQGVKKDLDGADALPKKRVSDLIARFNTGIVDNDAKKETSYKADYGASDNVGKLSHNFSQ